MIWLCMLLHWTVPEVATLWGRAQSRPHEAKSSLQTLGPSWRCSALNTPSQHFETGSRVDSLENLQESHHVGS